MPEYNPCPTCKKLAYEYGWFGFYAQRKHKEQGRFMNQSAEKGWPVNWKYINIFIEAHGKKAVKEFKKGIGNLVKNNA